MNATTRSIGNVLLVANFPSDTAYAWWLMEEFWITIGNYFIARGGRAYLAYPQVRTLSERVQRSALEVVALTVPGETLEELTSVDEFVRQRQIRTIYFTDRSWFNTSYARLRRAGARHILIHDHTPGDRPPVTGWKRLLKATRNKLPGVTADYMFCVSPLMRERDIRNGCIPAERCLVVQNGIPPLTPPPDRAALRQSLDIPEDTFVVVTTGRAHPYKRFDLVIRTAASLRDAQPDMKILFMLIGDGPAFDELQQLVAELRLEKTARLLGYRSDAQQILFAADAAMHAALGEGFSLSIIEYMSAGLPVLASDIPSVKQAIIEDVNGKSFRTVDDACTMLLELYRSRPQARAMGSASREIACSSYTLQRSIAELEAHFEKLCTTSTSNRSPL